MSIHSSIQDHEIPMERFYTYFDVTRQGYAKMKTKFKNQSGLMKKVVREIENYRSKIDRRAGSRTLYHNLSIKEKYRIGVTKFEQLVKEWGLSLAPMRVKVVTTQSCLQSWNYTNLSNGLTLKDINQLVVGDITYVSILEKRYFLFCLIDVFSSRIVGHHIGKRMRAKEAVQALKVCIKLRGENQLKNFIHHTDGGRQYFSKAYQLIIKETLDARISVAENCLANAYAEQRNSILKHHLIPTINLSKITKIEKEIKRIIYNYNHKRKQKALGWLTPVEFELKLKQENFNPKLVLHDHHKNVPSKRIGF